MQTGDPTKALVTLGATKVSHAEAATRRSALLNKASELAHQRNVDRSDEAMTNYRNQQTEDLKRAAEQEAKAQADANEFIASGGADLGAEATPEERWAVNQLILGEKTRAQVEPVLQFHKDKREREAEARAAFEKEKAKADTAARVKALAEKLGVEYVPDMTSDDVRDWAKFLAEKNKPEKETPEDPAAKAARIRQAQIDVDRQNHVGPDFRPQEGGQVTEAARLEFQRRKELADFDVKRAEREVGRWEKILNDPKGKAMWAAANNMEEDAADTELRKRLTTAETELDKSMEAQRKTLSVPAGGGGASDDEAKKKAILEAIK